MQRNSDNNLSAEESLSSFVIKIVVWFSWMDMPSRFTGYDEVKLHGKPRKCSETNSWNELSQSWAHSNWGELQILTEQLLKLVQRKLPIYLHLRFHALLYTSHVVSDLIFRLFYHWTFSHSIIRFLFVLKMLFYESKKIHRHSYTVCIFKCIPSRTLVYQKINIKW